MLLGLLSAHTWQPNRGQARRFKLFLDPGQVTWDAKAEKKSEDLLTLPGQALLLGCCCLLRGHVWAGSGTFALAISHL